MQPLVWDIASTDSIAFVILLSVLVVGIGAILSKRVTTGSRFNGSLIGGLVSLIVITAVAWQYQTAGYRVITSTVLWSGILIYLLGTLLWVGLRTVAMVHRTEPTFAYGHDDIQVRIMTIDAQAVVQETVNALPETLTDRHVIAESPIDIDGAEVHVVPDGFSCDATRKGRALEWARRALSTDREYVLYLDEDTIVTDFEGLPDADIVQFGERPYRTGSLIAYLSEIFRIGFQLEQRSFGFISVPLYAWGGGIAIRSTLEQQVTWDYDTLVEDTVFTWRAVQEYGASFVTVDTWFYNQAPATLRAMISQRRRWIGGAEQELWRLPRRSRAVIQFRNFVWGMTPIASVIPLLTLAFPDVLLAEALYLKLSFLLLLTPLLWSILGYDYFEEIPLIGVLVILFTPLVTVAHSAGAFVGLLSQPGDFMTTKKVGESDERTEHTIVNDGGLSRLKWLWYQLNRSIEPVVARFDQVADRLVSAGSDLVFTGRVDGEGLPFERRHVELRPAAILTVITALGTAVRFYGLGGASYWFDEIYSVTIRGDLPLGQLLVNPEPHPPLYYLLLKYWMVAFGQGEFAARSLSALFGVGTIVAIYFVCKELFDRSTGYFGAALLALSTFNIHASQTARMYEPLAFFGAVSLYFMLRVLDTGGFKNCLLYTLSGIAVLFTHLFGGFIILAQNIYVLAVLLADSDDRWARLKRWLIVEGTVSVAFLSLLVAVLLPQLRAKASGDSKAGWITVPTLEYLTEGLMAIGGAPFQYPITNFSSFSINASSLFLGLAGVALVLGTVRHRRMEAPNNGKFLDTVVRRTGGRGKLLGVTIFVCCFVLPFVLSYVVTPIFIIRYLVLATIGSTILIAGSVATIRRDSIRVALMVGLLVTSAGLVGVYHQTPTSEDWQAVSEYTTAGESTEPLLLLQPSWVGEPMDFYGVPEDADVVGIYQGEYELGPANADDIDQSIRSHETVYIVQRKPSSIDSTIDKVTTTHRQVDQQEFGQITVYKFTQKD